MSQGKVVCAFLQLMLGITAEVLLNLPATSCGLAQSPGPQHKVLTMQARTKYSTLLVLDVN